MWLEVCSCRWFFNVGDLKPGMTDFLRLGELIPRPSLTDDLNDFTSASAAHMTVTNTWMNTHTELEFPTVLVVWLMQFTVMTKVRQLFRSCG